MPINERIYSRIDFIAHCAGQIECRTKKKKTVYVSFFRSENVGQYRFDFNHTQKNWWELDLHNFQHASVRLYGLRMQKNRICRSIIISISECEFSSEYEESSRRVRMRVQRGTECEWMFALECNSLVEMPYICIFNMNADGDAYYSIQRTSVEVTRQAHCECIPIAHACLSYLRILRWHFSFCAGDESRFMHA